jgi:hypothetical protein
MKFDILNRFTGAVQFTAEIECAENEFRSIKIGLAVKWALKARANLAGADLADADLAGADLARANLAGANLAGADLADADLARANLARANLAGANLARADLAGADLAGADLARANLAGANLAGADLADAYLARANLAGANLAGADLADAKNLDAGGALKIPAEDIPVIPNIDAAILAAIEEGGKLDMTSWHGLDDHWCGTTHCRAGWAIHLAGEKGKALQDKYGPQRAGAMIYRASRPGVPAPWFFAPTDKAMDDIKKCAAEQCASK